MAQEQAPRDGNFVPATLFTGSDGATHPWQGDEATGRAYVDLAGGGGITGSIAVTQVAYGAGADEIKGEAAFTYIEGTNTLNVENVVTTGDITVGDDLLLTSSGSIINFNSGDVTITHSANALTFAGGTYNFTGAITGTTSLTLGVAAGTTGSVVFTGTTSGAVTMKSADAAGTWTFTLPTTDGDAGQFLQTNGSGVTTWASASAAAGGNNTEVQYNNGGALGGITNATSNGTTLTITSGRATTDFSPSSNDGAALGTTALGFSDLHLASGGVINWANGEMTITETNANLLTVAGGSFAVSGAITGTSSLTLGAAAGTTGSVVLTGTTSGAVTLSVADAAGTWTMKLPTTDGNANEFLQTDGSGNTTWAAGSSIPATTITVANEATDTTCFPVFVTAATGDLGPKSNANLTFNSNTGSLGATLMTATTSVTSASILASSNDSGALGAAATAFSDLFLATGAVIGFGNGNSVITHSSAVLEVTTGDLRVTTAGTNAASVVTVGGTQTLTNKSIVASQITTGTFGTGAYTMDTRLTVPQILNTPATISVSSNAGTVTRANRINNFTNSSAATMTITMSTTSATDGDMVMVVILDASAAAQTITWVNTENSTVTAPTTSNGSTTLPLTVGFKWNAGTSKWRCIAKA